ncbi:MAG: helix-turn-helix domain-containing protein [Rhodobiaceae bacterium]|nr:helix-turn-helix domain-containing protein [Rhodobiaceae bacterium]
MTKTIGLVAFEGCIGSSVHALADLFSTANAIKRQTGGRDALFKTKVLTPGGAMVTASNGHEIASGGALEDHTDADVLMISGIGIEAVGDVGETLTSLRSLISLLARAPDPQKITTGSCTGTFLLAEAGILDGRQATTTWWLASTFSERYPAIELRSNEIVVDTGSVITSAAGTSYLDLALHVIGRLADPQIAHLCAKFMVVDGGRTSQRPYAIPWHFMSRDPFVEKAETWVRQQIANEASVGGLASHLNMSPRTLHRRLSRLHQQTPQEFIQRIRMEEAMRLIETTKKSVSEIGAEIGYADENTFRRAFSAWVGTTPTQHRLRFNKA